MFVSLNNFKVKKFLTIFFILYYFLLFSLLRRACCRVTQLLHQPLHIYKIYKIYTLKNLRHVSVLRS